MSFYFDKCVFSYGSAAMTSITTANSRDVVPGYLTAHDFLGPDQGSHAQ